MEKRKTRRLPYAGTLPMPEYTHGPATHKQVVNPKEYFSDNDPVMERIYALGAPKTHTPKRDPEQAIRQTASSLRNTPFRRWTADQIQDAKRFLSADLVSAIIREQQQKKIK